MARIHGRNGIAYMGVTSGDEATPMAFMSDWTISFTVDKQDVTAMGDTNKIYVSGLPDAEGELDGFYDTETAQTYTAATDGIERKFYLYPSRTDNSQYFYGTILPDIEISGGVGDAVKIKSKWNAAGAITKIG